MRASTIHISSQSGAKVSISLYLIYRSTLQSGLSL
jgi:hypothetical protein